MKVAVIGTGPSGATACAELLQLGYEVDNYDIGQLGVKSQGVPKVKRRDGSVDAYNFGKYLQVHDSDGQQIKLFTSATTGGFSEVWGAAITFPHKLTSRTLTLLKFPISEYLYNQGLRTVNRSSHSVPVSTPAFTTSILAVDQKLCISCGRCLIGCPKNAIWSSRSSIENLKLEFENYTLIRDSQILAIKKVDKDYYLEIQNWKNKSIIISEPYTAVFLAAGTIASAAILLNSNLVEKIILRDTTIFYNIFWKKKSTRNFKTSTFGLAHQFYQSETPLGIVHIQIYPETKYALDRYLPAKPHWLRWLIHNTLFNVFNHFFAITIGYLPAGSSDQIVLSSCQHTDKMHLLGMVDSSQQIQRKELKRNVNDLIQPVEDYLGFKLWSLATKIGNFGESQHLSLEKIFNFNDTEKNDGVVLCDGMGQSQEHPGPITVDLMEVSSAAVRSWSERYPK